MGKRRPGPISETFATRNRPLGAVAIGLALAWEGLGQSAKFWERRLLRMPSQGAPNVDEEVTTIAIGMPSISLGLRWRRRVLTGITEYIVGRPSLSGMIFPLAEDGRSPEKPAITGPSGEPMKGLILNHFETSAPREAESFAGPVVYIDPQFHVPSWVSTDNEEVGRMAARHLLERGFKSFAFLGLEGALRSELRYDGFRETLGEQGLDCVALTLESQLPSETARRILGLASRKEPPTRNPREVLEEIARWISDLPRPVGLMAGGDACALIAAKACELDGRRVPADMAIVGADNNSLICESQRPWLSSVDTNPEGIGRAAARLLHRILSGEASPTDQVLVAPSRVVTRASSDGLATRDPAVLKAVDFMRSHLTQGIGCEDVAQAVGLSAGWLTTRFQKELGRTTVEQLRCLRLDRACLLLDETELPIRDIAGACGLTLHYFHNFFVSRMGMTPTDWRDRHDRSL